MEEINAHNGIEDPNMADRSYGDFYCRICDSHMNSEEIWEAHVTGRRHIKNVEKQDTETKYHNLEVESEVERALRNVKEPIVGLSYIHEFRRKEKGVPHYYNCFLCHGVISTVPLVIEHVISYKHRVSYIKEKDPEQHDLLKATNLQDKNLEPLVEETSLNMEIKYGRGKVKVRQEKPQKPYFARRTIGSSDDEDDRECYQRKPIKRRKDDFNEIAFKVYDDKREKDRRRESNSHQTSKLIKMALEDISVHNMKYDPIRKIIDPNVPDLSNDDYHCRLCDSSMNSKEIWQAHLAGKRHIKNLKKRDTESVVNNTLKRQTYYEDLKYKSELEIAFGNILEPIVGLSYINEFRSPGDQPHYNCILCQRSIATAPSVADHVISLKHRLRYIKRDDPEQYRLIDGHDKDLESTVETIAMYMEHRYGKGRVKIREENHRNPYFSKRTFDDDEFYRRKSVRSRGNDFEDKVWKSDYFFHDRREGILKYRRRESSDDGYSLKHFFKRKSKEHRSYSRSSRLCESPRRAKYDVWRK